MHSRIRRTIALLLALATTPAAIAQLQPARTIILIGPPGSGKSKQAESLSRRYKIPSVSMSELLRDQTCSGIRPTQVSDGPSDQTCREV